MKKERLFHDVNSGDGLDLHVWRFVNGERLCDVDNDALACTMTNSFNSAKMREKFGCTLQLQTFDENAAVRSQRKAVVAGEHREGIADIVHDFTHHIHKLTPLGDRSLNTPLAPSLEIKNMKMIVILHVQGHKIPFATGCKNYLQTIRVGKGKSFNEVAAQGIEKALVALKEQCNKSELVGPLRLLMTTNEKVSNHWWYHSMK
jgi:hypothetical protein